MDPPKKKKQKVADTSDRFFYGLVANIFQKLCGFNQLLVFLSLCVLTENTHWLKAGYCALGGLASLIPVACIILIILGLFLNHGNYPVHLFLMMFICVLARSDFQANTCQMGATSIQWLADSIRNVSGSIQEQSSIAFGVIDQETLRLCNQIHGRNPQVISSFAGNQPQNSSFTVSQVQ